AAATGPDEGESHANSVLRPSVDGAAAASSDDRSTSRTLVRLRSGSPDWVIEAQHIFRDDGHAGAKLQRPGLDALRDQAARAAFDVVLITAPDRLARNYVHPDGHPRRARAAWDQRGVDRSAAQRRGRPAKLRAGRLLPWTIAPYGYRIHPERP